MAETTLDGDSTRAGDDGPTIGGPSARDDDDLALQGDRGADVSGNGVEHGADGDLGGARGFNHKVLLTVPDEFCVGQTQDLHTGVGHLGGDRFVPQIEAKSISGWLANDPDQQDGSMKKILIWTHRGLTRIPKDGRARATLDVSLFGVERGGGGAPSNDSIHG